MPPTEDHAPASAITRRRSAIPSVHPTASVAHPEAPQGFYPRHGKPLLDRVLAAVGLVVTLPLMVLTVAAVFISLGGPVIFGQTRIGRGGRPFRVYKFRSMTHDRRSVRGDFDGLDRRITHKSAHDPRLRPTGRLLRKLSLDELPQLVNVLRGEMSLVGPRPELPEVIERHYSPWQHRRHAVKPGLTGLWQISERGNGMMHEHVDVDLNYVDRLSFVTDMRIMLRTIPAALSTSRGH